MSTSWSTRRAAALAGAVAAGFALAVTELLAGLLPRVTSFVSAIGAIVVDTVPPSIEDFAISLFGTNDKAALAVGTILIVLLIGAATGVAALRNFTTAVVVFFGFGIFGIAAAATRTLVNVPLTIVTGILGPLAGLAVLRLLLDRIAVERPAETASPDAPVESSRRGFLTAAAAFAVVALIGGAIGRGLLIRRPRLTFEDLALPDPVRSVPLPGPPNSLAVEGITPIVVPNEDFYRIDTALVIPAVNPQSWSLRISGLVRQEIELTLDELKNLPQVEDYVTIACVSNKVGGNLIGNAKWQGVPLEVLLDMARPTPEAEQVVGRSVDDFTAGFPIEAARDGRGAMVALGMNGEALPPEHGYPARLIVPGLYGYVSATKWLSEIELATWDGFDGYWIPRGWSKEGPIKTQSRIDLPRDGDDVPMGAVTAAGVAWAPTRGIERVEVQVDGGQWVAAELSEPLADTAWVQWQAQVQVPAAGKHVLAVRATDGAGATQTAEERPPRPDGATGYHTVEFVTV